MTEIFQVCVVNTDHAMLHTDLNTPDALAGELYNIANRTLSCYANRLLTVTEFDPTAFKKLDSKLNEFDCYGANFGSCDFIASFWSGTFKRKWNTKCQDGKPVVSYSIKEPRWNVQRQDGEEIVIHSSEGRYCAVMLESTRNKRLLYTSVHIPRKNGETARYLLLDFIKNEAMKKYQADGVIIAGEFNMKPTELKELFGGEFNYAINDNNEKTTEFSSVDNIIVSKSLQIESVSIFSDYTKLSHYPVFATITSVISDYF